MKEGNMKKIKIAAAEYANNMRRVDDATAYDATEMDVARYVAFKAGANWQKRAIPVDKRER